MKYRIAAAMLAPLALACLLSARPALPSPATPGPRTATFQQGLNGYAGTTDVEIWEVSPHTCLEGNPNVTVDADNDGGESQTLMRFDGVIGTGVGQVPPGATVLSAKLMVSAFDPGTTVHLHRMLVPWRKTATWHNLVAGVTADGLEASRQKDSFTFGKISASTSEIVFEVTDTVQAWVKGEANHGWAFINTGPNGWDFYSAEYEIADQRPKLVITYTIKR